MRRPASWRSPGLSLPVLSQSVDEREIGVTPLVTLAFGDGALGEGHGLTQFVVRSGQQQTRPGSSLRVERIRGRAEPFEQRSPGAAVVVLPAEEQAQLGIAVPGVMIRWVAFQEFLPGGAGLLKPSSLGQGRGQLLGDVNIGIEGSRLAEGSNGPLRLPCIEQRSERWWISNSPGARGLSDWSACRAEQDFSLGSVPSAPIIAKVRPPPVGAPGPRASCGDAIP